MDELQQSLSSLKAIIATTGLVEVEKPNTYKIGALGDLAAELINEEEEEAAQQGVRRPRSPSFYDEYRAENAAPRPPKQRKPESAEEEGADNRSGSPSHQ